MVYFMFMGRWDCGYFQQHCLCSTPIGIMVCWEFGLGPFVPWYQCFRKRLHLKNKLLLTYQFCFLFVVVNDLAYFQSSNLSKFWKFSLTMWMASSLTIVQLQQNLRLQQYGFVRSHEGLESSHISGVWSDDLRWPDAASSCQRRITWDCAVTNSMLCHSWCHCTTYWSRWSWEEFSTQSNGTMSGVWYCVQLHHNTSWIVMVVLLSFLRFLVLPYYHCKKIKSICGSPSHVLFICCKNNQGLFSIKWPWLVQHGIHMWWG